jgi:ferredoxin
LSVAWDPAFGTLLKFAEACDVPVRWACRTGVCHTCQTGLIGGAVAYQPEPLEPPEAGDALICCARPIGEVVLDL